MIKHFSAMLLIVIVLFVFVLSAATALGSGFDSLSSTSLPGWADRTVKNSIDNRFLRSIAPSLLLFGGAKEQDGIFITEDYLIENISDPTAGVMESNLNSLTTFLEKKNPRAAFVLIPTACAIKQQNIPQGADILNQRSIITSCYKLISGNAGTADAYSKLLSAKEQYIYNRTAPSLTGLGGYYVYTALASRLGLSVRPLDQFEVEVLSGDYYGSLYERSAYKGVSPDLLTLYRFSRFSRQYRLSNTNNGESKYYYTLFPTHLETLGQPQNVLLGGFGERLDISVASPYAESLLIFSDETVLAYLPFLMVHYGDITVINLEAYPKDKLSELEIDEYDQLLFSYSMDNFIHREVCAALAEIS